MIERVQLSAGEVSLEFAPELGGGLTRLDVGGRPLLRPWNGDPSNPFTLACNLLVPFSNRISGGGFEWSGQFRPVPPNMIGEDFPLHGDGFQRPWGWVSRGSTATLSLESGKIGPWAYRATTTYSLAPDRLEIRLSVTNCGQDSLPFGFGVHPWFPRSAETRLSFDADKVWLESHQHLPLKDEAVSISPQFDYRTLRPLSDCWVNNGFSGWTGLATIEQGAQAVSCSLSASENLNTLILFSPGKDASFFCLEPVSHPVDAFNLPHQPGLHDLAPGQRLQSFVQFKWALPSCKTS